MLPKGSIYVCECMVCGMYVCVSVCVCERERGRERERERERERGRGREWCVCVRVCMCVCVRACVRVFMHACMCVWFWVNGSPWRKVTDLRGSKLRATMPTQTETANNYLWAFFKSSKDAVVLRHCQHRQKTETSELSSSPQGTQMCCDIANTGRNS